MQRRGSTTRRFAFCSLELSTKWVRVLREGRERIGSVKERTSAMAAAAMGAPRPKSPPAYPDMCGRHRLQAEVQVMSREIGLLEEELHSVEGLQPASRSCKEVTEYVGTNPDPLVPVNQKKRKRCRIWWWIRVKLCLNFSWLCCACRCSCKFRKPSCCTCNFFRRFCCCCCCCDFCNCQPKCCRCCCSHCCRCCNLTSLFRCCQPSNCCNKPSSCCHPRCPKCSCGCVFSCPSCADCCLCPKCTRPCCVSRCLCP